MMEFKEGRYVAAVWFVADELTRDCDWMCTLYRDYASDGTDGAWEFSYRFRYYVDDKAHDSDDVKNVYHCAAKPDVPRSHMMDVIGQIAEMTSKQFGGAKIHKVFVDSDRPEDILKILSREDWVHVRVEQTKGEAR